MCLLFLLEVHILGTGSFHVVLNIDGEIFFISWHIPIMCYANTFEENQEQMLLQDIRLSAGQLSSCTALVKGCGFPHSKYI